MTAATECAQVLPPDRAGPGRAVHSCEHNPDRYQPDHSVVRRQPEWGRHNPVLAVMID